MPERDTTPIGPGIEMWPGMMPSLHWPGVMMPGQFGPMSRVGSPCRMRWTRIMSRAGIPSLMQTTTSMPASAASSTASAAAGGGTKISDALAPVAATASSTVLNTGTPSTVRPALPGVTPATI